MKGVCRQMRKTSGIELGWLCFHPTPLVWLLYGCCIILYTDIIVGTGGGLVTKRSECLVQYNARKIVVSNLAVKDSNRDLTQLVRHLAALQDGPFLALCTSLTKNIKHVVPRI